MENHPPEPRGARGPGHVFQVHRLQVQRPAVGPGQGRVLGASDTPIAVASPLFHTGLSGLSETLFEALL
jgi:hypothetical protein